MTHDHPTYDHPNHDHQALADMLDLDAKILAPVMRTVYADIEQAADAPVRSILDLGAGTGTGTFGLLQHFTPAHAIAVDASADMLAALGQRAAQRGLADRVTTAHVDLDEALPDIEPVDLVWASAALHHLADPDRTLAQITAAIRPGGLLAVVELDGLPRFLAAGTPGATAERHAHEMIRADRAVDMPTMGTDWGSRLVRSGLVVEQHRDIQLGTAIADFESGEPDTMNRYATAVLTRVRGAVADRLDAVDLQDLDALFDGGPDDLRHRSDLQVTSDRLLWIARRPT